MVQPIQSNITYGAVETSNCMGPIGAEAEPNI